ncbi:hypothetical protein AVEN_40342-1 [Araneus ventricosus]|uniref:Uncharacterized protein n=1 Tax=Araneus ventricosus TaxID=182803 RepID=A0A4Y2F3K7_ARAVE|nr:hypothetical protein AVEN_40342-1 [Araneus ventricosus]
MSGNPEFFRNFVSTYTLSDEKYPDTFGFTHFLEFLLKGSSDCPSTSTICIYKIDHCEICISYGAWLCKYLSSTRVNGCNAAVSSLDVRAVYRHNVGNHGCTYKPTSHIDSSHSNDRKQSCFSTACLSKDFIRGSRYFLSTEQEESMGLLGLEVLIMLHSLPPSSILKAPTHKINGGNGEGGFLTLSHRVRRSRNFAITLMKAILRRLASFEGRRGYEILQRKARKRNQLALPITDRFRVP